MRKAVTGMNQQQRTAAPVTDADHRWWGRPAWLRLRDSDDGIGMVTVIGLSSVIAIVVAITVSMAINSLASSRRHVQFEAAMATAESGLDSVLGYIQAASDNGLIYSSPEGCDARWTWASSTTPTAKDEAAWVREKVAAMPDSCMENAGQGEFISFRARNAIGQLMPVVYSVGWSPSRYGTERAERIVKSEYMFSPYRPSQAILTESTLYFSGSVTVDLSADATSQSADVHTNGNLTMNTNSLQVTGNVTSAGSNDIAETCPNNKITGTCTSNAPPIRIPVISARAVYRAASDTMPQSWYDLCPDGTVRAPDLSGLIPCSSTNILAHTTPFRGWTLVNGGTVNATWEFTPVTGTDYPGTYYAYQAHITINKGAGNGNVSTLSAIAEAKPNGDPTNAARCYKSGGNIDWKNTTIINHLPGLIFLGDGTIYATAGDDVREGVIAAGDNLQINTSSNELNGSLVASNICPTAGTNDVQGITVNFGTSSEVPLGSLIRTTQWLELSGK